MRYFKHLTHTDRLIIESMLKLKSNPAEKAKRLEVNRSTINRK